MFSHLGRRTKEKTKEERIPIWTIWNPSTIRANPCEGRGINGYGWREDEAWRSKQERKPIESGSSNSESRSKLRSFRSRWHFRKGVSSPLPQPTLLPVSIGSFLRNGLLYLSHLSTVLSLKLYSIVGRREKDRRKARRGRRMQKKKDEKKIKLLSLFVEKWKKLEEIDAVQFVPANFYWSIEFDYIRPRNPSLHFDSCFFHVQFSFASLLFCLNFSKHSSVYSDL